MISNNTGLFTTLNRIIYNSLFPPCINDNAITNNKNDKSCELLHSKYIKCSLSQSINCEKLYDDYKKCLSYNRSSDHQRMERICRLRSPMKTDDIG